MKIEFRPITRDQANEYVRWHYEAPYDFYDLPRDVWPIEVEGMLDEHSRTFAVLSEGEFIGIRSFGMDGRVDGGTYDDAHQDTGGALRPDMTARGLGEGVLRAGLQFGAQTFGFSRFRVTVAAFNERALKVCRRAGFLDRERFSRASDEQEFLILTMEMRSGKAAPSS